MLSILSLLLVMGFSPLYASNEPTWAELEALLGKRTDSKEFQAFVKEYEAWDTGKDGGGHNSPEEYQYSILYKPFKDWSQAYSIVIRLAADPDGWKPYTGKLPAGIKREDQKAEIEAKLGKSMPIKEDTWIAKKMDGYAWIHEDLEIRAYFNQVSGKLNELHISKAPLGVGASAAENKAEQGRVE